MTLEGLAFLNDQLDSLANYEFGGEWTGEVVFPYWVGEFEGSGYMNEDGMNQSTFTLTGMSKGTWTELLKDAEKIENMLVNGLTAILSNGYGIAIFYENSLSIPVEDAEFKRLQINLIIKEWRIN